MGCYIGEVFVRHARGRWTEGTRSQLGRILKRGNHWMIVTLPGKVGDREVNPIGRAFKRVENGEPDSIVYFLHVLARPEA